MIENQSVPDQVFSGSKFVDPKVEAINFDFDQRIEKVRNNYNVEIRKFASELNKNIESDKGAGKFKTKSDKALTRQRNEMIDALEMQRSRKITYYNKTGNMEDFEDVKRNDFISLDKKAMKRVLCAENGFDALHEEVDYHIDDLTKDEVLILGSTWRSRMMMRYMQRGHDPRSVLHVCATATQEPEDFNEVHRNPYKVNKLTKVDEGVEGFASKNVSRFKQKEKQKRVARQEIEKKRRMVSTRRNQVTEFNEGSLIPKRKPKIPSMPEIEYEWRAWTETSIEASDRAWQEIIALPQNSAFVWPEEMKAQVQDAFFAAQQRWDAKMEYSPKLVGPENRLSIFDPKYGELPSGDSSSMETNAKRTTFGSTGISGTDDETYSSAPLEQKSEEKQNVVVDNSITDIIHFNRSALYKAQLANAKYVYIMKSNGEKLKLRVDTAAPKIEKIEGRLLHKASKNVVTESGFEHKEDYDSGFAPVDMEFARKAFSATEDFEMCLKEANVSKKVKDYYFEKKTECVLDRLNKSFVTAPIQERVKEWLSGIKLPTEMVNNIGFSISGLISDLMAFEDFMHPMKYIKECFGENIANSIVDIVSISCLVYLLSRARNVLDVTAVVTQYLMGHGIDPLKGIFSKIIDQFSSMFSVRDRVYTESGIGETVKSVGGFVNTIFNSEFATAVRTLVLSVVATKWVPIGHVKRVFSVLGKPAKMNVIEITTSLLESLGTLIGMAEAVATGVPFSQYITAKDPYSTFFCDAEEVLLKRGRTYIGLPVPGKFCQSEYRRQLTGLLVCGNDLLNKMGSNPFETRKSRMRKTLLELSDAAYEVDEYVRTHKRTPPIIIVLHGDPSVGKSLLVAWLLNIYSETKNWKYEDGMLFSKGRETEYWEGYDPTSMPFILMSELGNTSYTLATREVDKELISLQSLCDGLPFICNMAFTEKGKVYADPHVVIVDTNNPELHLAKQVYSVGAFKRRIWYLHVSVMDEFKVANGTSLDKVKSLEAGGNILDRYNFRLQRYTANGNAAVLSHSFGPCDITETTAKLFAMMREYIEQNEQVKQLVKYDFVKEIADKIRKEEEEKNLEKVLEILTTNEEFMSRIEEEEKLNLEKAIEILDVPKELRNGLPLDINFDTDFMSLAPITDFPESGALSALLCDEEKVFTEAANGVFRHRVIVDGVGNVAHQRISQFTAFMYAAMDPPKRIYAYVRDFCFLLCMCAFYFSRATSIGRVFLSKLIPMLGSLCLMFGFAYTGIVIIGGFVFMGDIFAHLFTGWYVAILERMYLPRLRHNINWYLYRLGLKSPNAEDRVARDLYHPYGYIKYIGGVLAITTLVVAVKKFFASRKIVQTESHVSAFVKHTRYDDMINEIEVYSGVSRNKVFPKHAPNETWNTVHRTRLTTYNGDLASFYDSISRNIRYVRVWQGDKPLCTHLLGVSGTFALINIHPFGASKDAVKLEIFQCLNPFEGSSGYMLNLNQDDIVFVTTDIALINTGTVHFGDLVKHFANGYATFGEGMFSGQATRYIRTDKPLLFEDANCPEASFECNDYYLYACQHGAGLCGRPLLAQLDKNGAGIIGVHSGGNNNTSDAYAIPVTRYMLQQALDKMKTKLGVKMVVSSEGGLDPSYMPTRKSPVRHIALDNVYYEGNTGDKVMIKKKSKLERTPYYREIDEFMEETLNFVPTSELGKPTMEPCWKNGVYCDPYVLGLTKLNNPPVKLDYAVMDKVINRLSAHIISGLRERGVDFLAPVSFLEAVNGVEQDPFISRINASTSGAYGYPGPKSKYMPLNEDGITREPTDALRKDCIEVIHKYLAGDCANPIFSAQLKDEPREISKCESGATRLFYMSPLNALIVNRMYLSPFYSLMVSQSDIFCAGLGINMTSKQADELALKLRAFADEFLEGDYSGFDLTNSYYVGWMWCSIVMIVVKEFGYSDKALEIVRGIMTDELFPLIVMNADLFCKPGSVMSGRYATAESNTGRGLTMLMYAWYSNPELSNEDFFEHLLPLLYGDDYLVGVRRESIDFLSGKFNNLTYKEDCLRFFGMKVTPSVKNGQFTTYVGFDSASFLKRKFIESEMHGGYIAPLDLHSIRKSLMWYLPSDAITREHQTVASLTSSLWELYFHCKSREQFEIIRNFYCGLLSRHFKNWDGDLLLPTFMKIANSTGCLAYEFSDEKKVMNGDDLTVSDQLPEELGAFIDPLIPFENQDDEFSPEVFKNSPNVFTIPT